MRFILVMPDRTLTKKLSKKTAQSTISMDALQHSTAHHHPCTLHNLLMTHPTQSQSAIYRNVYYCGVHQSMNIRSHGCAAPYDR